MTRPSRGAPHPPRPPADPHAADLHGRGVNTLWAMFDAPDDAACVAAAGSLAAEITRWLWPSRTRFAVLHDAFDSEPGRERHGFRVGVYAAAVGRQLALDVAVVEAFAFGGFTHDLGRTLLPGIDPGPDFAPPNFGDSMRFEHPRIGLDLLAAHGPVSKWVRAAVLDHHERLDGTGYPRGLEGDDVPFAARVVALVNRYDTLTAPLDERPRLRPGDALSAMRSELTGAFDADLFAGLVTLLARDDSDW